VNARTRIAPEHSYRVSSLRRPALAKAFYALLRFCSSVKSIGGIFITLSPAPNISRADTSPISIFFHADTSLVRLSSLGMSLFFWFLLYQTKIALHMI
jgi:hypothetical protein